VSASIIDGLIVAGKRSARETIETHPESSFSAKKTGINIGKMTLQPFIYMRR
jgi:hypothetical protein